MGLGWEQRLMNRVLHNTIDTLGLRPLARRVKKRLMARGLWRWDPLVPEDNFKNCAKNAIETLKARGHAFGDYVEFGVSRGTSMACMHDALSECGITDNRLIGFDSFEGLAPEAAQEGWEPGDFASSEAATRRFLRKRGIREDRLHLVRGWFNKTAKPQTIKQLNLSKLSLLMMDCDTYQASVEGLKFASHLIDDEFVVLFDDWGWAERAGNIGQKEAFKEFLEARPNLLAEELPSYRDEAHVFLVTNTAH